MSLRPNASPSPSVMDIDTTFLPVAQMRQIARVTSVDERSITGEVDVGTRALGSSRTLSRRSHFPGTLMIEAAGRLVALWAWAQGQRGRPRLLRASAEFHRPAGPATRHLVLQAHVRGKRHLQFATIRISADGEQLATMETVLAVLPPVLMSEVIPERRSQAHAPSPLQRQP